MNGKQRTSDHKRSGQKYLDETKERYTLDLKSGLYHPHRQYANQSTDEKPETYVNSKRPNGSWPDWITAGVGVFGLVISIATLIGLAVTALFSIKQWHEANRNAVAAESSANYARESVLKSQAAINLTRKQFAVDQRPYMWIEETEEKFRQFHKDESGVDAGKMTLNVWIKNYGKSPAINVRTSCYLSDRTNPEDDIHWEDLPQRAGGIVPPGMYFFRTARTAGQSYASRLALHILVKYEDQAGNSYRSEVCRSYTLGSPGSRCTEHNNMK